jgi:hypothetical protein
MPFDPCGFDAYRFDAYRLAHAIGFDPLRPDGIGLVLGPYIFGSCAKNIEIMHKT